MNRNHLLYHCAWYATVWWLVLGHCSGLEPGILPKNGKGLEIELLASQVDAEDPILGQPYVVCDSAKRECIAAFYRIQNSAGCRQLEVTAHIAGVPVTPQLTQRLVWPDEHMSDIERPIWPELIPIVRQHLFQKQQMQLPVYLAARCVEGAYSNSSLSSGNARLQPVRRMALEQPVHYPKGVPVLLSLARGTTAMQLAADNQSVVAVLSGFSGCQNASLAIEVPEGAQRPDNCTAALFVSQREILLDVQLALPLPMLPAAAMNATGATILRITKPGILPVAQRFILTLRIDAPEHTPATVSIIEGALSWEGPSAGALGAPSDDAQGMRNARSNVLRFVFDGTAPALRISAGRPLKVRGPDGAPGLQVTMLLDYKEHVFEINPLRLFNISVGIRTDVVYEVSAGRLWLTSFFTQSQLIATGGILRVWANNNAVTDAAGNGNLGTEFMLHLPVKTPGAQALAKGVQVTVAVLLALGAACHFCLPAGALRGPLRGPVPAAMLAASLGLLLSSQTIFFSGMAAVPQLPGSFLAVADALDWTALSLRPWWMESTELDPAMGFPYPPVVYVAPKTQTAPKTATPNNTKLESGVAEVSGWSVIPEGVQQVGGTQGWLVAQNNITALAPMSAQEEQFWNGNYPPQNPMPLQNPIPPPPSPQNPIPSPSIPLNTPPSPEIQNAVENFVPQNMPSPELTQFVQVIEPLSQVVASPAVSQESWPTESLPMDGLQMGPAMAPSMAPAVDSGNLPPEAPAPITDTGAPAPVARTVDSNVKPLPLDPASSNAPPPVNPLAPDTAPSKAPAPALVEDPAQGVPQGPSTQGPSAFAPASAPVSQDQNVPVQGPTVELPVVLPTSVFTALGPAGAPGGPQSAEEIAAMLDRQMDIPEGDLGYALGLYALSPGGALGPSPSAGAPVVAPVASVAPSTAPSPIFRANLMPFKLVPNLAPTQDPSGAPGAGDLAASPLIAKSIPTIPVVSADSMPPSQNTAANQLGTMPLLKPLPPLTANPPPQNPAPPTDNVLPSGLPADGLSFTAPPGVALPVFRGLVNPPNTPSRRRGLTEGATTSTEQSSTQNSSDKSQAPASGPSQGPSQGPSGTSHTQSGSGATGTFYVVTSLGMKGPKLTGRNAVARIQRIQSGQLPGQKGQLYKPLETVMSWAAILVAAVAVFSTVVLVACALTGWQVPLALFVPAPAVLLWLISVGPVSFASAVLFSGDVGQVLLGCLLLFILAVAPIMAFAFLLHKRLGGRASSRQALFVQQQQQEVLVDGEVENQQQKVHINKKGAIVVKAGAVKEKEGLEVAGSHGCSQELLRGPKRALRALLGYWGSWLQNPTQDPWFASRYGLLFLPARGSPLGLTRATYKPKYQLTNWLDTPRLFTTSPSTQSPFIPLGNSQVLAVLALFAKGVAVGIIGGCTGGSVGANGSVGQCAALLLVCVLQLVYWGTALPWNSGLVQSAMMLAGAAETVLACCLLVASTQDFPSASLGNTVTAAALAILACYALLLLMLLAPVCLSVLRQAYLAICLRLTGDEKLLWKLQGPGDRFAEAVRQLMAKQPLLLQRKYADRWLMRVYGTGLYGRPARSWEIANPRTPSIALKLKPWQRETLTRKTPFPLKSLKDAGTDRQTDTRDTLQKKRKDSFTAISGLPGHGSMPSLHEISVGLHSNSSSEGMHTARDARELRSTSSGGTTDRRTDSGTLSVPLDDMSFTVASFPGSVRDDSSSLGHRGSEGALGGPADSPPRLSEVSIPGTPSGTDISDSGSVGTSTPRNSAPQRAIPMRVGPLGGTFGRGLVGPQALFVGADEPEYAMPFTPFAEPVGPSAGPSAEGRPRGAQRPPLVPPLPLKTAPSFLTWVDQRLNSPSTGTSGELPPEPSFAGFSSRNRRSAAEEVCSSDREGGQNLSPEEQDRALERAESGLMSTEEVLLSSRGASGALEVGLDGAQSLSTNSDIGLLNGSSEI